MNFDRAVSIIKEVRGTQLQADVVDAFLRLVDKGEFRAPDDVGGGTTEDINNIHKQQQRYEKERKEKEEKTEQAEKEKAEKTPKEEKALKEEKAPKEEKTPKEEKSQD